MRRARIAVGASFGVLRRCAAPLTALLASIALAAGGAIPPGASSRSPCGTARHPQPVQHVVWIWMENTGFDGIVGNRAAPFLNGLAAECGLATGYQAVAHPSLPNYIAATSGDTWGIADDAPPAAHPLRVPSIFDQLTRAGRTWRSYEESMPSNCALDSAGLYAVKHNPAAYYIRSRGACARWDVPLGTLGSGPFRSDLRAGRLPSFSFVTPNLCNDMHDCPTAAGDRWLSRWVPLILSAPDYRAGTTVVFVTFDEAEDGSNRVATIVVSPATPRGTTSALAFTHYSLLKTTEQLLRLPVALGHAAAPSTASMRRAFRL